jgi:hypothetical protein
MKFHNREGWRVENELLRVTVLRGGGHIAEMLDKKSDVSPLWIPPWPSIDPSEYHPERDTSYGRNNESKLLAGIMGHNLCLDTFGPPSAEQLHAGISGHGEASVACYEAEVHESAIHLSSILKFSQLKICRIIRINDALPEVHIVESVRNLSSSTRQIAWTQHVSLGPPFLVPGKTQFLIPTERSRTFENEGFDGGGLVRGTDFDWPLAPAVSGGTSDLSTFAYGRRNASFTTHLLDRSRETAFFTAYSPEFQVRFGYQWRRNCFPWIGVWEENMSRTSAPWNGRTIACGMEFGASPFPETNQHMIERGSLLGVPVSRTLGPYAHVSVEYSAFFCRAGANSGARTKAIEVGHAVTGNRDPEVIWRRQGATGCFARSTTW